MIRRWWSVIAVLLMLAAASGCQHLGSKVAAPKGPDSAGQAGEGSAVAIREKAVFSPGSLRDEELSAEIANLELTSRDPQASNAEKAEALRRLALLYLAPHNPARNLTLAAEAQAAYLKLQPPEAARQEGEIWLALVLDSLRVERLLQQQSEKIQERDRVLAELGGEKQRLAQKIAAQETVNAKLKADIEKLKFIDLSVEKKRKSFR